MKSKCNTCGKEYDQRSEAGAGMCDTCRFGDKKPKLDSNDLHWLVTTAKNLCPQWMNPIHHAHYMDVRGKLIEAFERGVNKNAQPTAQLTEETCKWRRGLIGIINPHIDEDIEWSETFTYCPTCGKIIEVTE